LVNKDKKESIKLRNVKVINSLSQNSENLYKKKLSNISFGADNLNHNNKNGNVATINNNYLKSYSSNPKDLSLYLKNSNINLSNNLKRENYSDLMFDNDKKLNNNQH
jgi:hypothetical protein